MKLNIRQDFTSLPRAGAVLRAGDERTSAAAVPFDIVSLPHDERHLRRRVIELAHGDKVLVDLPEPVVLGERDLLVLDDGRTVEVFATDEPLYEIVGRDAVHVTQLAWHIGNRHLAADISATRILILRDHVIKAMLEGLGATVVEVVEAFHPVHGAYSGHGHGHGHEHGHEHDHHHH